MTDLLRNRMARSALLTGGLLLVVGAMVFGTLSITGRLRHDRAILEWNSRFGSWEDLVARYPHREANDTALRLEELAARIGVNIAPESIPGRRHPKKTEIALQHGIQGMPGMFLRTQIEREIDRFDPPPQPLVDFLGAHAGILEEIRQTLLSDPEPRWELYMARGPGNPLPNLLGHVNLQKILLADAMTRSAAGDPETALRNLEASWRLNGALRGDPVLITQMIAMTITSFQAGVLRHIDGLPQVWTERMRDVGFRRTVEGALHNEIRYWSVGGISVFEQGVGPIKRAVIGVAAPYVRLCLADVSEQSLHHMEILSQLDNLCDGERAEIESGLTLSFARWNVLAPLIVPNLANAIDRIGRLELDIELTARVLDFKTHRATHGAWPEIHSEAFSTACPADRWIQGLGPDGQLSIQFSRKVGWPENSVPFLPSSHILDGSD